MEHAELGAWLRLTLSRGVGNDAARRLLARFGLPQDIFTQSPAALREVVTPAQADALAQVPEGWAALLERTAHWLAQAEGDGAMRGLVALGDPRYPRLLLETADPPLLLYAVGAARWLQPDCRDFGVRCGLAIVGSRNPTPQGERHAHDFAQAFAAAGLTVVSGLALGVDGAAHAGALAGAADGVPATLAVVGTGPDRIYPARHRELAHRIAAHGLIVSEYPLGTPPLAANFPKRNRLIAGLSQGTLVVEAALASGSLITARLAAEQGREVFAIPGSIQAPQSRGCHALIRQGAKLVESAQDVLEELRLPAAPAPVADAPAAPPEHPLLAAMGYDPVGLDALVARTGIATADLQVQLLELELAGAVARLPGGLFQRVGVA
ncbi:DNA-processing protein DprA [Ramlibacter sp. H39-3-26]|uniref:DNA-processing protein DprA n=1 Tax=Curvibacter soli TaxID=3031331 RepID=UPI0023DB3CAB|nr:DNA-processing protein DprA [Ramlibacter sp. H39-3-26]MDF1484622.1 DNA-processing protein DprA [Ramlibacter sp. H39-3-26]